MTRAAIPMTICKARTEEDLALLAQLLSLAEEPEVYILNVNEGHSLYSVYDGCNMSCPENFSGYLIAAETGWLYVPPRFHEDLLWLENSKAAEVHGIPITSPELNKNLIESRFTEGIRP